MRAYTRAAGGSTRLTGLEITTPPERVVYSVGQTFDPTGMVVTATFSDGSSKAIVPDTIEPGIIDAETTEVVVSYSWRAITLTASYPLQVFLYHLVLDENSWEDIARASAAGLASTHWNVGDTKTETFNGKTQTLEIIGFDHDDLNASDPHYDDAAYNGGKNKAGITFCMKDMLSSTVMNNSSTNSGGWDGSVMRNTYMMRTLKGYMPSALTDTLRMVTKLASSGSSSSSIRSSADELFLLAEIEVFGSTTYSRAGEGTHYAYYAAGNSRIKQRNGSADEWWLRSPYSGNYSSFVRMNTDGSAGSIVANGSAGVAAGFCI